MSYLFWIKKLALMISINTRKFRPSFAELSNNNCRQTKFNATLYLGGIINASRLGGFTMELTATDYEMTMKL